MKLDGLKGGKIAEIDDNGFKTDVIFPELEKLIHSDKSMLAKIAGVYRFDIKEGPGGAAKTWTVDIKNGDGFVREGVHGKIDCTIVISDEDYIAMVLGTSTPQQLFMAGKLKVAGNLALGMFLLNSIDLI